jgi:CheY-like chemotaxis protein
VVGDQRKIRQVLINLLGNAVKFTDHGGVILRVFSETGDRREAANEIRMPLIDSAIQLVLEVEDTGVGISEQDMDKVFQPFEQVGEGRTADGGTGLGLPISLEFVRTMGGNLTVASRVGQGSVFRVAIPIQPGREQVCQAKDRRPRVVALQPGQPNYRILVVDDIQTNRDILSSMLMAVGLDVRTANDGRQAVAAFEEWRPHAILMDMKMPVMDGCQATKAIKSRPDGEHAVVIAVSAGAWEEEKKTVLAEGPDDFIRKPFREEDVFDALRNHLGIQYVYAQCDVEDQSRTLPTKNPREFKSDSLDGLSPQLINDLSEAAFSLDFDRLNELLLQVQGLNPPMAETMRSLLKRYDFEAIL